MDGFVQRGGARARTGRARPHWNFNEKRRKRLFSKRWQLSKWN
jgi:hypothetical protein